MTTDHTNLPIIHLKWLDAAHCDGTGWKSLEDYVPTGIVCETVGFLIHEDEETITLATSIDIEGGNFASEFLVPKVCIKERKQLASN